jgi:hypothetical protein
MLTASSSIYDDGEQVSINASTFSINNTVVLSNGTSSGYLMVKYTATQSFDANVTYSISHNLNSVAIIYNFWDEDTGDTPDINVRKISTNIIDVMTTVTVSNGRIVIIS